MLRTFTLKEADKVCLFFTREAGKLRGVAHGARRLRSRYGASLEPFTEVALVYYQKENKDLVSVANCEIIRSQFQEGMSSELLGVMHYLAELVIEFLPDHEQNVRVYRLIAAVLKATGSATKFQSTQLTWIVRYFEIWMLKLAGFFPDWNRCDVCGRELGQEPSVWLTNEGAPQCVNCSGGLGEELRQVEWKTIQDILLHSPGDFLASPRDVRVSGQIGRSATRLINRALERELKSYDVLDRLKPALTSPDSANSR
ncbi:MAG: DNA repair protein RecO [Blastocatellia bacterium]|nr:DNA repair protein RecO [Blastocatellia bacterium]